MRKKTYHHGDLKNALVTAGEEILNEGSVEALSLRQVAKRAGVSHSAPYAHFADREALFAAISAVGFEALYTRLNETLQAFQGDPAKALVEIALTYINFALERPMRFQLMFSGIVKDENKYPDLVIATHRTFALIENQAIAAQDIGLLRKGESDILALSLWSLVHGFVCLYMEGQISTGILNKGEVKKIVVALLSQVTLKPISL
ncbi:MAG: TetR/AcrR family transcriptional regulator [Anaerolineaceae bacterium]|nr:TetR/AcrR family transcriptional regulator [Anaerolineaceae bacterium]